MFDCNCESVSLGHKPCAKRTAAKKTHPIQTKSHGNPVHRAGTSRCKPEAVGQLQQILRDSLGIKTEKNESKYDNKLSDSAVCQLVSTLMIKADEPIRRHHVID